MESRQKRGFRLSQNYLHACFEAFGEVTEKKYGAPFDYAAIEASIAPLRNRRSLTYEDLRQFESPGTWRFQDYWVFPPEHKVASELKQRKFNFWRLPKEEKNLIASLLEVFKSIELVSIILRFVCPEHYGIISPPVERILNVRRGSDAVKTYINYIENLREIAKGYGFRRVADADMALWVIHERCYGDAPNVATRKEPSNDLFMLRLRAKNLMADFSPKLSDAQLARSLFPVDARLAGPIAAVAFERMVHQREQRDRYWDDRDLIVIINDLHRTGAIDRLTHEKWQKARLTRNDVVHGRRVSPDKLRDLIALLEP